METTENIEMTRNVLRKFSLDGPIPEEQRKYIRKNRRRSFISLIKLSGKYSLWKHAGSYAFFGCTRFGLQLTMLQSGVIFVAVSVLTAAVISTGGYLSIKHFVLDPVEENPVQVEEEVVNAVPIAPVKPLIKKDVKPKFTLNLVVEGYSVDQQLTKSIEKRIKNYFIKNGITIAPQYLVSGEISYDEVYFITIKATIPEDGSMVYFKRKSVEKKDNIYPLFIESMNDIYHKTGAK